MRELRDAVICEPLRTAVGGYGGQFKSLQASDLAAVLLQALMQRSGIRGEDVDDVILGQGYANGEAPAIGRIAALDAGLPMTVPGAQVDRRCGSGLQAVIDAAMRVQTGAADLVVSGGAESMSNVEHYVLGARWGLRGEQSALHDRLGRGRITSGGKKYPIDGGMIETAENLRREFDISRDAQDALALRSHERASAAQSSGKFTDEIVPVSVSTRRGEVVVDTDEHIRPDTSLDALAQLSPIRREFDAAATVTAGNASGQNDGAAVCIVTTREKAEELGLRPYARMVSWAVSGVDPRRMGLGPVPSAASALSRAGLSMADIDLIELNEAFAAQVLACTSSWGFGEADFDRLNVNGSGISLGHPVGATGARILATMLHELDRREGRYALETMCVGGGQGLAAVFERIPD
ncbi:MAG: acetyl-CoA C-acetyltransferase [Leucobacter sp.]